MQNISAKQYLDYIAFGFLFHGGWTLMAYLVAKL